MPGADLVPHPCAGSALPGRALAGLGQASRSGQTCFSPDPLFLPVVTREVTRPKCPTAH